MINYFKPFSTFTVNHLQFDWKIYLRGKNIKKNKNKQ